MEACAHYLMEVFMPDLPEYQPNQQVTPGPLIDSAPIYQGYSKLADQIEETTRPFAQQLADKQAIDDATAAGSDPNFHTIPSIGEAARVYNAAGLAANKQELNTNLIKGLTSLKNSLTLDANGNPIPISHDTVNQFNAKNTAYLQGILSTTPIENRQFVKNKWAAMSTDIQSSFQKQLNKQYQNDASLNAYDSYNTSIGNLSVEAKNGNLNQAASEYGQLVQNLNNNVQFGNMKPIVAARYKQQALQTMHLQTYSGNITRALNTYQGPYNPQAMHEINAKRGQEVITQFQNDPEVQKAYNTPLKMHSAVTYLKQQLQQQLGSQKVGQQQMALYKKALTDQVFSTGHVDPATNGLVTENMSPEQLNLWDEQLDFHRAAGLKLRELQTAPIQAVPKIAGDIMGPQNYNADKDPVGAELQKQAWQKLQSKVKQTVANRQYGYSVVDGSQAYSEGSAQIDQNPRMYPDPNLAKSQLAVSIQRANGYNEDQLEVRPKQDAIAADKYFNSLTPSAKINYVQNVLPTIVGKDPYIENLFLAQMQRESKDSQVSGYMLSAVARDPSTNVHAFDVAQAQEHTTKEWADATAGGIDMTKLKTSVSTAMSPVTSIFLKQGMDPKLIGNYQAPIENYAAYLMATQSMNMKSAVKKAANVMLLDHYQQDSMNGASYNIPVTDYSGQPIDKSQIHAMLHVTLENALKGNIKVPPNFPDVYPTEKARQDAFKQDAANTVTVVPSGGTGLAFRYGKNFLRMADGSPVVLSYSDAVNAQVKAQEQAEKIKAQEQSQGQGILGVIPGLGSMQNKDAIDILSSTVPIKPVEDIAKGTKQLAINMPGIVGTLRQTIEEPGKSLSKFITQSDSDTENRKAIEEARGKDA